MRDLSEVPMVGLDMTALNLYLNLNHLTEDSYGIMMPLPPLNR